MCGSLFVPARFAGDLLPASGLTRIFHRRPGLTRVLDVDPRNAKAHFLLARTLFRKGDRATALIEVKRALDLNPAQREFVALRNEMSNSARR